MEEPESYIDGDGTKRWHLPNKGKDHWHRLDGPAIEWYDGTKWWYVDGRRHRLDGPAIEYVGGSKSWYVKGKLHRLDGPAIEWYDGSKHWYVDDKLILPKEWFKENGIDPDNMDESDAVAFKLRWL